MSLSRRTFLGLLGATALTPTKAAPNYGTGYYGTSSAFIDHGLYKAVVFRQLCHADFDIGQTDFRLEGHVGRYDGIRYIDNSGLDWDAALERLR